jgi:predicted MPP superfamily phosphohydrolase
LGTIINRNRLSRIVKEINTLNPDIVLFAGDIVDEDIKPVIRFNLGEMLLNIKAKYGVYAITGNHEYIGGAEKADKYLSSHGIKMLRDTTILINNSFYICGREDRDSERFSGKKRKELKDLLIGIDTNKTLIVLNHQPTKLYEAVELGVDLHLSGHTHNGQLFPFNFITKKIYEISYGYKKTGNSNFYVSSGVGSWGPPIRIGNKPEIVNIKLWGKE